MRYNEFIAEDGNHIANLKQTVASKIIALPDLPPVEKTLKDIEDILHYVNAGGRMSYIQNELVEIDDPQVQKAHKILAKYIASIEMTSAQKAQLFELWKADKLVNRQELLSGKNVPLSRIFNAYDNPAIRELVEDLSSIAFYGQGKGEFLLSVMSRGINKMSKGDLRIDDHAVEVKTLDKGAGRFFDDDVKPTSEYNLHRDNFIKKYGNLKHFPPSGMNINHLTDLVDLVENKKEFENDLNAVIMNLFPGQNSASRITDAIIAKNANHAKQLYAQTNVGYYINVKRNLEALDGVLYIDLKNHPMSMMFVKDFQHLAAEGLRLHADTIYPITGAIKNCYPQISMVVTKAGDVQPVADVKPIKRPGNGKTR